MNTRASKKWREFLDDSKERGRRIHWQELAYLGMRIIDQILGNKLTVGNGTTEDTFEQDCDKALSIITTLRAEKLALQLEGERVRELLREVWELLLDVGTNPNEPMRWNNRFNELQTKVEAALSSSPSAFAEEVKKTLKMAADFYDDLATDTDPLACAAKHGPDYEPPTREEWNKQCLEVRDSLNALLNRLEGKE